MSSCAAHLGQDRPVRGIPPKHIPLRHYGIILPSFMQKGQPPSPLRGTPPNLGGELRLLSSTGSPLQTAVSRQFPYFRYLKSSILIDWNIKCQTTPPSEVNRKTELELRGTEVRNCDVCVLQAIDSEFCSCSVVLDEYTVYTFCRES